jgi:acyl carrier protein
MSTIDVEGQIKEAIVEKLGVDESKVTPTASFINDLGADSLDTVEFIMDLETRFNIQIPDDDQEQITTVGDAINYVKSKLPTA